MTMPLPALAGRVSRSRSLRAETVSLLGRASIASDATYTSGGKSYSLARDINRVINWLKAGGVWDDLHFLHIPAMMPTSTAAHQNWKSSSFTLTPISSPVFTTYRGIAGDGAASYYNTGFTPSVSASLDSFSIGCWVNSGAALSGKYEMGAVSGSDGTLLRAQDSGTGNMFGRVNQATTRSAGAVASPLGLSALSRTSAALVTGYRNGVTTGTFTDASTALPTSPLALGAITTAGVPSSYTSNRIAADFAAAGLDATKMAILYAALAWGIGRTAAAS